ncbi:MAG: ABC transporter substrate-binding protein [Myxococcales bacterium]|nr:ABC transporter substrate-binding protein [Myxococcales bacterium]
MVHSSILTTMRKPEHQWETSNFRAVRRAQLPESWAGRPRAEVFDLHQHGGETAGRSAPSAWFSLGEQVVDRAVLDRDGEDVRFAAMAWLAARGARTLHLRDERGEWTARGAFEVSALSTPADDAAPRRLVTLCPSNAELVASLGCFDRVIACEDSSDWPDEIRSRERLGPDLGPNLDRVRELAPDLAVSSLSVPGMERVVTGLRRRGVPQVVLAPRSVDDVLANLAELGVRLGVRGAADAARAAFSREREALAQRRPAAAARVYLEWWPRPMFSPGADCYSNELIELAGGVNVFRGREGSSVQVTPAELVAARPDVCFVSWCGVAEDKLDPNNLITRAGLETLHAARQGRVYRLDERFSGRPGPRMLEAARIMADAIAALADRR